MNGRMAGWLEKKMKKKIKIYKIFENQNANATRFGDILFSSIFGKVVKNCKK